MIEEKSIQDLRDRIATEFRPQRIILFGSYANGAPTKDSDIDLLIIMKFTGSGLKKAVEIVNQIQPKIPVDLVVRTPKEIKKRLQANDFFLADILRHGRVLYEAADQRMD